MLWSDIKQYNLCNFVSGLPILDCIQLHFFFFLKLYRSSPLKFKLPFITLNAPHQAINSATNVVYDQIHCLAGWRSWRRWWQGFNGGWRFQDKELALYDVINSLMVAVTRWGSGRLLLHKGEPVFCFFVFLKRICQWTKCVIYPMKQWTMYMACNQL